MKAYNHKKIEKKWQKKWEENGLYKVGDPSTSSGQDKPKYYVLDMFPYPSGDGLHVGHPKGYIATDILARMKMMQGYNVLHPMGWDAFGLPAENYAIKNKVHPRKAVEKNIKKFKSQLEKIGFTYDWSREINTTDPEFYKITQWMFLQMFKKGLAYESSEPVNWCPGCKTVLANEDLENGKCERCGAKVEKKSLRQWVLKITNYADRLLKGLDDLDWEDSIKEMQRNWIGRSEGVKVKFSILNTQYSINSQFSNDQIFKKSTNYLKVFTTRPDTLFGCTYMVLSPEHPLVAALLKIKNTEEVKKYINEAKNKSDLERTDLAKGKTGVELKGIKAINPVNNEEIPIWIADYVLASYGTGAIMAVPAHDSRDYEFAKKYNLPIRQVVKQEEEKEMNCIIIHGSDFEDKERTKRKDFMSQNKRHWIPWTKKELEKREIKTSTPLMPKNWAPVYEDWKKEFEKLKINENTILIGHSLGGNFLVRWLSETKKRVKKLILIAPSKIHPDFYEDFYKKFDNYKIDEKIKERVDKIIIFISNNDKKYILQSAKIYQRELNAKLVKLENRGHFIIKHNPINKKFLELLDEILKQELNEAFTGDGVNINSGFLDGLKTEEAKKKITEWLEKNKLGKKAINYKLRDWVFSRQRYWGEPIPIIHCEKCGAVAVPEKDLPVKLPDVKNYEPTGTSESPLANIKEWINVKCPKCGGAAKRETNTMPQWAGSSWYYLAYIMQGISNFQFPISKYKEAFKNWMPVDFYVGGAEHATRHLIYARFWHKFLYDIKVVSNDEPFKKLQHVGLILAEDGRKMSKRWSNVINPDDIVEKFGADSLRIYEMFMGPFGQSVMWNMDGLVGARRFIEKVYKLRMKANNKANRANANKQLETLLHRTIKKVTEDIESFDFNTAVSQMMILVNAMEKEKKLPITNYQLLITLLSPFAPHMAEELWHRIRTNTDKTRTDADKINANYESIFLQPWPKYNPKFIKEKEIELVIQINGKVRDKIKTPADILEDGAKKIALESEKIKKWIGNKKVKKIIFVKGEAG